MQALLLFLDCRYLMAFMHFSGKKNFNIYMRISNIYISIHSVHFIWIHIYKYEISEFFEREKLRMMPLSLGLIDFSQAISNFKPSLLHEFLGIFF